MLYSIINYWHNLIHPINSGFFFRKQEASTLCVCACVCLPHFHLVVRNNFCSFDFQKEQNFCFLYNLYVEPEPCAKNDSHLRMHVCEPMIIIWQWHPLSHYPLGKLHKMQLLLKEPFKRDSVLWVDEMSRDHSLKWEYSRKRGELTSWKFITTAAKKVASILLELFDLYCIALKKICTMHK